MLMISPAVTVLSVKLLYPLVQGGVNDLLSHVFDSVSWVTYEFLK